MHSSATLRKIAPQHWPGLHRGARCGNILFAADIPPRNVPPGAEISLNFSHTPYGILGLPLIYAGNMPVYTYTPM
jgi:hypothetical protein